MELKHTAMRDGRLSSFLKGELGLSTGLMNRLKWNNQLLVNGTPQRADYQVKAGDVIVALLDDPAPQYPAQDGEISILYEDEHLLAVDKPAGMLIHPSHSRLTDTLANFVLGYYQKTQQSCAFHPITRLDRDTFGVVLLAKNAHVHALCNALHNQGLIEKTYWALVFGCPAEEHGTINAPIARLPLPSLLRKVDPDGKKAITNFSILQRYDGCTKLSLQPVTGRTHQLRVHCAHMGFPILGDPQYGTKESLAFSHGKGYYTQQLCAYRLQLPHPITGGSLLVTSRLDLD